MYGTILQIHIQFISLSSDCSQTNVWHRLQILTNINSVLRFEKCFSNSHIKGKSNKNRIRDHWLRKSYHRNCNIDTKITLKAVTSNLTSKTGVKRGPPWGGGPPADDDRGCYDPVWTRFDVKFDVTVSMLPASKFFTLNHCRTYSFRCSRIRYYYPLSKLFDHMKKRNETGIFIRPSWDPL